MTRDVGQREMRETERTELITLRKERDQGRPESSSISKQCQGASSQMESILSELDCLMLSKRHIPHTPILLDNSMTVV